MKKIILCLFLLCSFGPFAKAQVTFSFDSIWVPPYICQAAEFDVEVFGMVADGSTQYGSQRFLVQNDTVWVNFEFVQGTGPATPYPLYRKITVPAPGFGTYKIVAQGVHNGQVLQTLTSRISICTGIAGVEQSNENASLFLKLSPNPVRDFLTIEFNNNIVCRATICDLNGKIWLTQTLRSPKAARLPVAELPADIYLLQIQTGNTFFNRKFMKFQAGISHF